MTELDTRRAVHGEAAPAFRAVEDAFGEYAAQDPTYRAQLTVYVGSELAVDLACGPDHDRDALLPVFSCGKGAIGIVVALLVQDGALGLDEPVCRWWPDFAQGGKASVTVRQLLSHQAGLVGVDGGFTADELYDHDDLAARLAAQVPWWRPGAGHGYHSLTLGTLADELVRRVTGQTLAQLFSARVAGPQSVDVHLGLPAELDSRVVPVELPSQSELAAFPDPASLVQDVDGLAAQCGPRGTAPVITAINGERFRRSGQAAVAGIASARGLARMYAAAAAGLDGPPLLTTRTMREHAQIHSAGPELTGGVGESRFGIGFLLPSARLPFGSPRAFGHDGAGGGLAFHDPAYGISFGYTVQRMPLPGGADARALRLSALVRDCVRGTAA